MCGHVCMLSIVDASEAQGKPQSQLQQNWILFLWAHFFSNRTGYEHAVSSWYSLWRLYFSQHVRACQRNSTYIHSPEQNIRMDKLSWRTSLWSSAEKLKWTLRYVVKLSAFMMKADRGTIFSALCQCFGLNASFLSIHWTGGKKAYLYHQLLSHERLRTAPL